MMRQVAARLGRAETVAARRHSLRRAYSTAPTEARRPTASSAAHVPYSIAAVRGMHPPLQKSSDAVPAPVSYGAWTHATPHLTRQERIEGLRKLMQARDGKARHHAAPTMKHPPVDDRPEPVEAVSQAISCAKQPQLRVERVAQIQRSFDATRATQITIASHPVTTARHWYSSYSQLDEPEPATPSRHPGPAIDAPWPAGWRLSDSTEMPVFSYGEWLRAKDASEMDKVTAARQFLRLARN